MITHADVAADWMEERRLADERAVDSWRAVTTHGWVDGAARCSGAFIVVPDVSVSAVGTLV